MTHYYSSDGPVLYTKLQYKMAIADAKMDTQAKADTRIKALTKENGELKKKYIAASEVWDRLHHEEEANRGYRECIVGLLVELGADEGKAIACDTDELMEWLTDAVKELKAKNTEGGLAPGRIPRASTGRFQGTPPGIVEDENGILDLKVRT